MKIAMWSGPRNLSTAMMYAFAQRADTAVWDEPFYAAYLKATGIDHPFAAASMAGGETDPAQVAQLCCTPPLTRPHHYQKHMTHHMIANFPLDWLRDVTNVFLIRHPARVVASYLQKREEPNADDLGFARQAEIYDHVCALGQSPVVVDSFAVREDPEAMLGKLCAALGLAFDPAMLSWPQGGNAADGPWAPHWYGSVHRSTGFAGPEGPLPDLTGPARDIAEAAMPVYERLKRHAL